MHFHTLLGYLSKVLKVLIFTIISINCDNAYQSLELIYGYHISEIKMLLPFYFNLQFLKNEERTLQ